MIVVDTDARLFNDDCASLAMMLSPQAGLDVRGIIAVPGNVWAPEAKSAVSTVLRAADRTDVPVFLAAQRPLANTAEKAQHFDRAWGPVNYFGAFRLPFIDSNDGIESSGLDFLAQLIRDNPGQVTIAALGPLTNVAIFLIVYPQLAEKIKSIVWMGGTFHVAGNATSKAEFNFWFDPKAAQIVLRSRIKQKIMFGLDVCNHFVLTRQQFDQIVSRQSPMLDLYREGFGSGFPGFLTNPNASCFLWDELVAAYLAEPSLVTDWEEAFLDVDSSFTECYGATLPLDRELAPRATPVRVAVKMKRQQSFDLYARLLG